MGGGSTLLLCNMLHEAKNTKNCGDSEVNDDNNNKCIDDASKVGREVANAMLLAAATLK